MLFYWQPLVSLMLKKNHHKAQDIITEFLWKLNNACQENTSNQTQQHVKIIWTDNFNKHKTSITGIKRLSFESTNIYIIAYKILDIDTIFRKRIIKIYLHMHTCIYTYNIYIYIYYTHICIYISIVFIFS